MGMVMDVDKDTGMDMDMNIDVDTDKGTTQTQTRGKQEEDSAAIWISQQELTEGHLEHVWYGKLLTFVHVSFEFDETVHSKKGRKVDIYNKDLTQFQPYVTE
jgi:hypothetical protein